MSRPIDEGSEIVRLRTTTISILAVGLLAGSTVGVAAQDESRLVFEGGDAELLAFDLAPR